MPDPTDHPRPPPRPRPPRVPARSPRRTMFRSGVQPLQALLLALLAGAANGRFDFAPVAFDVADVGVEGLVTDMGGGKKARLRLLSAVCPGSAEDLGVRRDAAPHRVWGLDSVRRQRLRRERGECVGPAGREELWEARQPLQVARRVPSAGRCGGDLYVLPPSAPHRPPAPRPRPPPRPLRPHYAPPLLASPLPRPFITNILTLLNNPCAQSSLHPPTVTFTVLNVFVAVILDAFGDQVRDPSRPIPFINPFICSRLHPSIPPSLPPPFPSQDKEETAKFNDAQWQQFCIAWCAEGSLFTHPLVHSSTHPLSSRPHLMRTVRSCARALSPALPDLLTRTLTDWCAGEPFDRGGQDLCIDYE
jgi:hypothetical protein